MKTGPVNCPECGRFEGHVVTCTSWRPVRCNPADIMARRAGEGVAATPPTAGRQQFVRCPKMGVACTVGCPPGGCVIKDSWLQSGPIDPYTPASSGPQVVDSSAWTGRDAVQQGLLDNGGRHAGYQPMPRGAKCLCEHGLNDKAGGFWCCGGTPGMPQYREHPFYERSKAALVARGLPFNETMTSGHNKEQTMASTRADLIQRCNRTTIGAGDIRIEAVERRLPAGGRAPSPACSDVDGMKERDAATRKETLRELAVVMRTIIRKYVSGTTLDNTDCVLLTAILDDYFGDKAGEERPTEAPPVSTAPPKAGLGTMPVGCS